MIYDWKLVKYIKPYMLEDNKPIEVNVVDKVVGLLKKGEDLFAFSATCPHASARLCDGWIDAKGHITCPLHKYKFDPKNGRNTTGEGYKLKIFPVEVRDGNIYIGL